MDSKAIREWLRQLIVDRDRAIDGGSGEWQAATAELFPRDKPPRERLFDAAVASLVASDKPIAPTVLQDMRTLREAHERYLRAELDQYDEDGVPSEYDIGDLMHAFGQDFERVRSMISGADSADNRKNSGKSSGSPPAYLPRLDSFIRRRTEDGKPSKKLVIEWQKSQSKGKHRTMKPDSIMRALRRFRESRSHTA